MAWHDSDENLPSCSQRGWVGIKEMDPISTGCPQKKFVCFFSTFHILLKIHFLVQLKNQNWIYLFGWWIFFWHPVLTFLIKFWNLFLVINLIHFHHFNSMMLRKILLIDPPPLSNVRYFPKGFFQNGNFPCVFSKMATSHMCNFPNDNFPRGIFSNGNFPNVQFPKRQLPKG